MQLKVFKPSSLLASYIDSYRFIESRDEIINRVLPGTSVAIAFTLTGKVSYVNNDTRNSLPSATLSGLRKSMRLINYTAHTRTLIILFTSSGAAAFIRHPLNELFEESVPLGTLFPPTEISEVRGRLCEAHSDIERIAHVEAFLLSKLVNPHPDKLVHEAIARIRKNNGVIKISTLADGLCISHDAFEKRFRKFTGTTPKQFSMVVRMKAITQNTSPGTFLDLAVENGYYDQAHFNKDFKLYTGLTPSDFFRSGSFW